MFFFHSILWNIISSGEVTFSNGKFVGEFFGPHFNLVRTIGELQMLINVLHTALFSFSGPQVPFQSSML